METQLVTDAQTSATSEAPRRRNPVAIAAIALVLIVVVGAAVGLVLNATQSETLPVETLVGNWDVTSDAHATRFHFLDDGTYTTYADELAQDLRVGWGTYRFDADTIVLHAEGGRGCEGDGAMRVGSDGSYMPTFDGPDAATLDLIEDECGRRAGDMDGISLARNLEDS